MLSSLEQVAFGLLPLLPAESLLGTDDIPQRRERGDDTRDTGCEGRARALGEASGNERAHREARVHDG